MTKVLLGDVVDHIKEKIDKDTSDLDYYVGGEHIDCREIIVQRKGNIQGSTIGPAFHMRFRKGDVLLMSRNPHLCKASMVDFDGICSDVSYVCRTKDNTVLLQSLVPFIMQTPEFWQFAEENKRGGLPFFLNWKDFARFEFTLIPIERQEELSNMLWAIERVKGAYRELITRTDELVKSQFIELFGSIKEPKCNYVPLKSLTDVCSGGTPDRKKPEYWENGTIPWVKTTELQNEILANTEEHITEKGLTDSSAKIVPPETILIAMYGQGKTRGMTAMLGIEACTNQACACILPTDGIRTKFLWQYFICSYEDLRNLAKGSNQANLNAGMIKDYLVPLPDLASQIQFEKIVEQSDKSKFAAQQTLNELTNAQKALMKKIFE